MGLLLLLRLRLELLVLALHLLPPVPRELALDLLGRLSLPDDPAHELLLLVGPLLALGLALALLDLAHQQRQVGVLLVVAREHLVVLGQELLVVPLADQVPLLLHQLHVPHVELRTRLDLLDYADQVVPGRLQLPGLGRGTRGIRRRPTRSAA